MMKKANMLFSVLFCLSLFLFATLLCEEDQQIPSITPTPVTPPTLLPSSLPFELTRTDVGDEVTAQEVADFTSRITGAYANADYFNWLYNAIDGMSKDNPDNMPYYGSLYGGVTLTKAGDTITFLHNAGDTNENMFIGNSIILANVLAAYKLIGDEKIAEVANLLARGVSATMMACVWDENTPEENHYVMARSLKTQNYTEALDNGKSKIVDWDNWGQPRTAWNTERINVPNNPYWGDIWLQNKRSKDDVCHIFRMASYLPFYMNLSDDQEINEGIQKAYHDLQMFSKDIVDNGYRIRNLYADGHYDIMPGQDLGSFVMYGMEAECNSRLGAAFLGYEDPLDVNCGNGVYLAYELVAETTHKWNARIFRTFHLSAVLLALLNGENDMAKELLEGVIERNDNDWEKEFFINNTDNYQRDMAAYLVQAAAVGMPLTSREVALIHQYYDMTIESWNEFEYWDIWDDSHPDGNIPHRPSAAGIRSEEMANFFLLCASPFTNPSSKEVVDCSVIADPAQWGQ